MEKSEEQSKSDGCALAEAGSGTTEFSALADGQEVLMAIAVEDVRPGFITERLVEFALGDLQRKELVEATERRSRPNNRKSEGCRLLGFLR